jgi:methionyl-tRNA formyltransferase
MKNIIFLSKSTGLECLKFHLEKFKEDINYIVVCNPDKEVIKKFLCNNGVEYCDIEDFSVKNIENIKFDWLLNLWGGYIFKKDILSLVNHSLNIHPSYLPYGRGRDPVVWAIRDEAPAGVTLHEINEEVDGGDIWFQEEVPYSLPIMGGKLYENVVSTCISVFKKNWPKIRNLNFKKNPQNAINFVTRKRKDLIQDRVINYEYLTVEQKDLFLKILAHDFGESYSSILNINKVSSRKN